MLNINRDPNWRICELGGGAHPIVTPECLGGRDVAVDVRICQNEQGQQTVDIVADLNEPLPLSENEFDACISHFLLEHISWRNVRKLVAEMFRIIKPGGKVVCITANTQAQLEKILKGEKWDTRDDFEAFSCILFGDNDYQENTHRNYLSPEIANQLFSQAGFSNIVIRPYGQLATDMCIEGMKPQHQATLTLEAKKLVYPVNPTPEAIQVEPPKPVRLPEFDTSEGRASLFSRQYFEGGTAHGGYRGEGYRDFPVHEIMTRNVLIRRPQSVVELGCGRGYLLKRLQDEGVTAIGFDISRFCYLTRVCDNIMASDVCDFKWTGESPANDLCLTVDFLDRIPEEHLPKLIECMRFSCKRGLHVLDFNPNPDDKTKCTQRPIEWWVKQLPLNHEVESMEDFTKGEFPNSLLRGDGKMKLNLGCAWTCFHRNWHNIDNLDIGQWAAMNKYHYVKQDLREGLPYETGTVHLIFAHHFLEHLSYKEGLSFLRECRRVIHPEGAMRIAVPNLNYMAELYKDNCVDLFNTMNKGCEDSPTQGMKLYSLLMEGHKAMYDYTTLVHVLRESGWKTHAADFRHTEVPQVQQVLKETVEMSYGGLSLFLDATPQVA